MLNTLRNFVTCAVLFSLMQGLSYAQDGSSTLSNVKVKTMLLTSAYGALGGALIGTALNLDFEDERRIALGASIGLYAGIIFGLYLIVSYEYPDLFKPEFFDGSEEYIFHKSPLEKKDSFSFMLPLYSYQF